MNSAKDKDNKDILTRIGDKLQQLSTNGITGEDEALLKSRLEVAWGNDTSGPDSTAYRKARARRNYNRIQNKDNHIFLAFVLLVAPTECSSKGIGDSVDLICRLEDLEPYRINLKNAAKGFQSTAKELGFSTNPPYLAFITDVFKDQSDLGAKVAPRTSSANSRQ